MAIEVGSIGPEFALPDQEWNYTKLTKVVESGAWTVVFFFPQAGSPGCTKEVCGFRDAIDRFQARGVHVLGIGPDALPAIKSFAEENQLNFPILADADRVTIKEWGVARGDTVARMTFVLDDKGVIRHIFPRADVFKHAGDVLAWFSEQLGEEPAPAAAPVAAEAPAPATPPAPLVAAAGGESARAPASVADGDLVGQVARAALTLLLAHAESGGAIPADVSALALRVAARGAGG